MIAVGRKASAENHDLIDDTAVERRCRPSNTAFDQDDAKPIN